MAAMGSGNSARPIVHLESGGGTRTAHFSGEETPTKKVCASVFLSSLQTRRSPPQNLYLPLLHLKAREGLGKETRTLDPLELD